MTVKTVPDLFKAQRHEWLEECRTEARRLLTARPGREITVEDVLELCPRPTYIHRNSIGGIFRDDDFRSSGWTQARKASSNKRWIMKWRLSDERLATMNHVRRARQPEMVE